jgi:hypothetical protein
VMNILETKLGKSKLEDALTAPVVVKELAALSK